LEGQTIGKCVKGLETPETPKTKGALSKETQTNTKTTTTTATTTTTTTAATTTTTTTTMLITTTQLY
jgi:hypothetical protein